MSSSKAPSAGELVILLLKSGTRLRSLELSLKKEEKKNLREVTGRER